MASRLLRPSQLDATLLRKSSPALSNSGSGPGTLRSSPGRLRAPPVNAVVLSSEGVLLRVSGEWAANGTKDLDALRNSDQSCAG